MDFTLIDVRSVGEFTGGNVAGSVNIPLDEVVAREEEIMALAQPVVFCCASGNRSGKATDYFKAKGLDCENGGGWMEVNERVNG
ncbi:MAG: phage shock protein E [Flavobacteriaceae bacterium]|jgi:phage shock protein E